MLNVQNIQVLKGPQGTLFGRNTTGGAILVQTAEPSTEAAGQARLSYGRYNEVRGQAYATFGLSDRVAIDAEGLYSGGDGWQRNISNGKRVGDYENWSVRLGLKADLTDDISILLRYQHDDNDDPRPLLPSGYRDSAFGSGAPFFAAPGEITYRKNEVALGSFPTDREYFRAKANLYQATIRADLGFANLTSYTQYRKEDVDAAIDGDYYATEIYQLGLPNDNKTFSQELLLTSKPGGRLQYTVGLFYFENTDTYRVYFDYFPAFGLTERSDVSRFGSSTTTRSYAAFADFTYELTPQLFVTAGGRYARDQIDGAYFIAPFDFPNRNFIKTFNPAAYEAARQEHFTPRLVLRYKPTDDTSIYASYTRGYKAALLDVGGGSGNYVRPEKITAYEVGAKYDGDRVSLEGSAFYYDYKDLQVSLYRFGQAQILNAAKSEIYGLDAQVRFDVTDSFQVAAGGAWVHARYKRFQDAPVYTPCLTTLSPTAPAGFENCLTGGISFPVVPAQLTNTTMQRTPEFTGNLAMTYRTELAGGELVLSGNLYYSSSFFFGPSGIQFRQGGYETLSLRAQWTDPSDRFSLAFWGDNVTNSRYLTQVQYNNNGVGGNWSKPTTFGVEFGAKF
ncbi:MAG: TonB-dependent receptor [Novosphingobium sp.]